MSYRIEINSPIYTQTNYTKELISLVICITQYPVKLSLDYRFG